MNYCLEKSKLSNVPERCCYRSEAMFFTTYDIICYEYQGIKENVLKSFIVIFEILKQKIRVCNNICVRDVTILKTHSSIIPRYQVQGTIFIAIFFKKRDKSKLGTNAAIII